MEAAGGDQVVAYDLTVGEVARSAGERASAVRFYDDHGVVRSRRSSGNQRRFSEAAICRIRVARFAQSVGLTVHDISTAFSDLPDDPSPEDWAAVSDLLTAEAETRVSDLKRHLAFLRSDARLCDSVAAGS